MPPLAASLPDMRISLIAAALAALVLPAAAQAELPAGARAPNFSTQAAIGGRTSAFNLSQALRRGPVVLYFYPKSFTQGCTLEARAFAEAHDQFAAAGATVIGLSADDIATQRRFSTEECRSKFAIGVATPQITRSYDVAFRTDKLPPAMQARAAAMANATSRTSYVIGQDGRIRFVHSDLDYRDHVRLTLQAVQALRPRRR